MDTGRVKIMTGDSGFQAAVIEDSDTVHCFFVDHLLQGQVPEPIQRRVADPITPVLVSLDQEGENEGQGGISSMLFSFMLPYFFGVLLVLTIFTSANYLLRGVAEEKTSLIIEIILSSVTARQLLAGKVLGLGALGLTQVVVWMGTFVGLSAGAVDMLGAVAPVLSRPEVLVLGVVYYLLGFLMYSVLMGATAALGSSMRESQQMAGMFTLTAMLPLMMGGFMMTNPNMSLARILSWFPLTAPTMMMLRLPMTEVPVIDVAGSILVILICIPIVLWAGAKVFRLGLLMQGKRPTLFEIWRWLRET
jgi:ABC-2 type transport system permease protein